jgi:hypothetical protein
MPIPNPGSSSLCHCFITGSVRARSNTGAAPVPNLPIFHADIPRGKSLRCTRWSQPAQPMTRVDRPPARIRIANEPLLGHTQLSPKLRVWSPKSPMCEGGFNISRTSSLRILLSLQFPVCSRRYVFKTSVVAKHRQERHEVDSTAPRQAEDVEVHPPNDSATCMKSGSAELIRNFDEVSSTPRVRRFRRSSSHARTLS